MSGDRDLATWAALRMRLAEVEAYIPEAPAWRPAGTDELTGTVRAGSAWGRPRARSSGRRTRLVVAFVVLSLLALLAAVLYVGTQRRPDLSVGPYGPYGHLRVTGSASSATLLADGRVLDVSGEWQDLEGRAVGRASLWDPASGSTPISAPLEARVAPTLTLLLDGRVLVTGGFGGPYAYASTALASAELWDPVSTTFRSVGAMATPRVNHLATVLQDGRVLIVGGVGPGGPIATAEVYDPLTESFSPAGTMATAGAVTASVLLDDGTVLLGPINQLWRPQHRSFTTSIVTMDGAEFLTLTRLEDGKVLRVQGTPADASTDIMFWSVLGQPSGPLPQNLGTLRTRFAATRILDGRVLVTGGVAKSGDALSSVEAFDPGTGSFVELAPLRRPVADHTAILLPDGRVLIVFDAGGPDQDAEPFLYDPGATAP